MSPTGTADPGTHHRGSTKHRGFYNTHKTESIKKWPLAHPCFHPHFKPTGSSWLNLLEP
ncbi:hypothetical protein [Streptomyces sp. NPDC052042]|uniref:hypothetical protein n=1 Tax=Streptomyces sp. NPDC052042 TaxID=3365683 RepID=UPI0037D49A47